MEKENLGLVLSAPTGATATIQKISTQVDSFQVGLDIEEITKSDFKSVLESAIDTLYKLLSNKGLSDYERTYIKTLLHSYHQQKKKLGYSFSVVEKGIGLAVAVGVAVLSVAM